jgi:hypothetical protein
MPSMTTWATCTPKGWNSLARHCESALNANFPQPDSFRTPENNNRNKDHNSYIIAIYISEVILSTLTKLIKKVNLLIHGVCLDIVI